MGKIQLMDAEEAKHELSKLFGQSVEYTLFRAPRNGRATFLLGHNDIIVNPDQSVTWFAREIGVSLHSFIELTTGENHKKTVCLPLCLVNPQTREAYKPLLESTVGAAGKLNEREAEFYVFDANMIGALIKIKLENLALHYIMLQLFPSSIIRKFKSKYCPFCGNLEFSH